jgi:hypothetical protein
VPYTPCPFGLSLSKPLPFLFSLVFEEEVKPFDKLRANGGWESWWGKRPIADLLWLGYQAQMNIVRVIAATASLFLASGNTTKPYAKNDPQSLFGKCPGADALGKAVDVSWEAQASRLSDHLALRKHLRTAMPVGTVRVMLWSTGMHHTSVQFSVVAVRNAEGEWHTSAVGEEGPGLLPIEHHPMQTLDRALTSEEGLALDKALADPCLYASPTFQRDPSIAAGGATQTIEVDSPSHKWVGSWLGTRTPQEENLINLIAK